MGKTVKVKRIFTHTYELPIEYYDTVEAPDFKVNPEEYEIGLDVEDALELLYGGQGEYDTYTTVRIEEKDD